ncbi:MAG TPA: GNAT family N-acetyltransferase [Elusimicrobia bacterium]|nr:GNAT family N-acetyltransferase [Elusimicrobiota bacterium]
MPIVRPQKPEESALIEEILRKAYGREEEARLFASLRGSQDFLPQASLVADHEGQLVGYVLFLKASLVGANDSHPALAMALFAVLPEFQRRGMGERLIRHSLERCRGINHHLFFVIGDPAYFSRFGFQDAAASGLGVDFAAPPAPLQVLDLSGSILGRVQGKIRYPQGILSK